MKVLSDGGIVLGIFPDAKYLDVAVHLAPGNKLLLFTDGITEATNPRGQEYGEDRLRRELDDDPSGETATPHHKLMQDVSEFCQGNFADDATLVLISFLPSAKTPVIQQVTNVTPGSSDNRYNSQAATSLMRAIMATGCS